MHLIQIHCRGCDKEIFICRSCWRGQVYCSEACRIVSQCESHRKAQKRYRESPKGKRKRNELEQRRRMRMKIKEGKNKKVKKNRKSVDDEGTTVQKKVVKFPPGVEKPQVVEVESIGGVTIKAKKNLDRRVQCHLCGCIGMLVDKFPRRGYSYSSSSSVKHAMSQRMNV